ncbi:MAG TPA: electron transport complex subunit RsxD [Gammaproteobacteria bacterium]
MPPSSPHAHGPASVSRLMARVILALLPGIAAYAWAFGPGILVQLAYAGLLALAAEALLLRLRGRPLAPFLGDLSAVLTALLLALALPPLAPWWFTAIGVLFAIVVAKHLYGGLGYNPFNPAMVGFVVLMVSFPLEMTRWPAPLGLDGSAPGLGEAFALVFGGTLPAGVTLDALSGATPLDHLRTGLAQGQPLGALLGDGTVFGHLGGRGWEWIQLGFLAGGLYLLASRTIDWRIPAGLLAGLLLPAALFHLLDGARHASPLFHALNGATVLGAFFIATDPVTASTTPRGRLLFGAGIGLLTWVIRTFGGYPDAIAFAVLLMNMAAPIIDHYTRPRAFGEVIE